MKARNVLAGSACLNPAIGTVACGLVLNLVWPAAASDWPQFLGPTRDAVYAGPALAEDWPREGPKMVWQAFDEKASAASPVLAVFHGKPRVLAVTRSALHCFDPDTGADAWSLPTRRQSSGNVHRQPRRVQNQVPRPSRHAHDAQLSRHRGRLRVRQGTEEAGLRGSARAVGSGRTMSRTCRTSST